MRVKWLLVVLRVVVPLPASFSCALLYVLAQLLLSHIFVKGEQQSTIRAVYDVEGQDMFVDRLSIYRQKAVLPKLSLCDGLQEQLQQLCCCPCLYYLEIGMTSGAAINANTDDSLEARFGEVKLLDDDSSMERLPLKLVRPLSHLYRECILQPHWGLGP